jgi:O-antigen/teichoic acid export membrane protein
MSKQLLKSFLIYGIGAGLSQSLLILLVPVYTNYFNTAEYGAFEVISSGFILLTIFGMLQIESAIGRYYYDLDTPEKKKHYISTAVYSVAGFSLVVCLLASALSNSLSVLFFDTEDYSTILRVAFMAVPLANLFNLFAVMVRYEQKPVLYSIVTFLQISLNIAIALYCVISLNTGIIGVFYGQIAGFSIGLLLYLFYFRKYLQFSFDKAILNNYFHFSLPMIPAVLGSWLNNHANRFLMVSQLTLSDIGIYSVALKVASVFKLLDMAFRMAWQPFFIQQYQQPGHKELYRKVFRGVSVLVLSLVAVMFLIASPLIQLITTPEYYASAKIVGLLSLALALPIIASTVNLGPILKKKQFTTRIAILSLLPSILAVSICSSRQWE